MSLHNPFKLLEINVISAQDLPPVSKLLRTYVVAWVHADHKLTTRVDHQGHTNPTWNYKLVFQIDDKFLNSDASAVTIEIYNVAWLRDIPIGTARVLIHNLFPPSTLCCENSTMRSIALQICRPSGHLQGILNVGVNLINSKIRTMPLYSEISTSTVQNHDLMDDSPPRNNVHQHEEERQQINAKIQLHHSVSERTTGDGDFPLLCGDSILNTLERGVQPKAIDASGSVCSVMRPLPSEVAEGLRKGLYSMAGDELGSSIFDGWTVAGDRSDQGMKSKVVNWQKDDKLLLKKDSEEPKHRLKQRRHSDGGLFSCFGNAYGFEFTFMCGSKNAKKNKKKRVGKSNVHVSHSEENLRMIYI